MGRIMCWDPSKENRPKRLVSGERKGQSTLKAKKRRAIARAGPLRNISGSRRLAEALADVAEIVLDQIDVGDAQTVEIPVIQKFDEYRLLRPAEEMVAGTEVAVAEFPAVEGNVPHVDSAVLGGMEEASDAPLRMIEETGVFAAVDDVEAPGLILRGPDRPGEGRQVFRPPHVAAEPLRPPAQTIPERLPGSCRRSCRCRSRPRRTCRRPAGRG